MKNVLILAFFAAAMFGVQKATAQSNEKDIQAVSTAVESLRKLMIDPTQAGLEKLTAPKLTYGHSAGKVEDQAAFIRALMNNESDFTEIVISEQTVDIVDKIALVRHKFAGKLTDPVKGPSAVNLSVLQVWYKVKNEWKLIARQAVRI